MAHHKHHTHKPKAKKAWLSVILFALAVAFPLVAAFGVWKLVASKLFHAPVPSTCCKPSEPVIPVIDKRPPSQPAYEPHYHILVLSAWCDHMPIWNKGYDRRHLTVKTQPSVDIMSVEVRHNDKLLGAFVRRGIRPNDANWSIVHMLGVFDEGMHDADLAVTITYMVKGVLYETVMNCTVSVTN